MNRITNPIQTQRAWWTWQRPLEQNGRRDRIQVAELVQGEEGIGFSYLGEESLRSAHEAGFHGYPGLALHTTHQPATATDVLKRRLPSRNRPDFPEFLETFGRSCEAHFTELSLLAYTGARLVGDSFGITETFEGIHGTRMQSRSFVAMALVLAM